MITAVDTSVLLDVLTADATYGEAAREALRHCRGDGRLVACEVVWAEIAAAFDNSSEADAAMRTLSLGFATIERSAALRAGDAWRLYRARGGTRERVVADFLVGAHAIEGSDRLLTRDRGFHRGYFDELTILDPAG